MGHRRMTFFYIVLLVAFCKDKPKQEPSETKEMYVTSYDLNVRDKANKKGKLILILPHGTKVKAVRVGEEETIGKLKGFWYKIEALNGFVFGHYLSDQKPKIGKKKFKLASTSYGGWGDPQTIYVSLFHHKARVYYDAEGHEGPSKKYISDLNGNYVVTPTSLKLTLSGYDKECDIEDDETLSGCEKTKSKDPNIELVFNKKLKAYTRPGFKPKGKHNKKKCQFITPLPDDESIDVEDGYFCRRKHKY